MDTKAIITCPECEHKQEVEMPTDKCQHFYQCLECNKLIKPKENDCCVYCSYGDKKCPMKQ